MLFRTIHTRLENLASAAGITALFVLAHTVLVLMMVFTFPRINAALGTRAFDLQPLGYSKSAAMEMLQHLDQATIDLYLFPQLWLLDLLYPLLLALFLSTCIIRLSGLLKFDPHHLYSNLFLLPFLAMCSDYLENIMISVMITHPATVAPGVIRASSIFTWMKGVCTTLSWLVILILLFHWLIGNWKRRKAAAGRRQP